MDHNARNGEEDTIAYSGDHLTDLLAISGQRQTLLEPTACVETTVVMAGTRAVRRPWPEPASSSYATDASSTGSIGAVALSLSHGSPVAARDTPPSEASRYSVGWAAAIAGVVLAWLIVGASTRDVRVEPSTAAQRMGARERAVDVTPVVRVVRQKAASKRPVRPALGAPATNRPARALGTTRGTAQPHRPTANEAAEDQKLLDAARLERAL